MEPSAEPTDVAPSQDGGADQPDQRRSRTAAVRERYARARDRVDRSAAGHVQRRWRELDIMNHGLILASLGLTLLVPALITLAALFPVGSENGVAPVIHRFGLSSEATNDLRQLFPSRKRVAGTTTALSAIVTLLWSIGWPAELARGYQAVWNVRDRSLRDLWRAFVWLVSFIGLVAYSVTVGRIAGGAFGAVVQAILALPVLFAWSWWSQHLLLGGRISWRALVPGAVITAVGLIGLGAATTLFMPRAIESNFDKYGPIGMVFALLTWLVAFAVVMLGCPLLGHIIHHVRHPDPEPAPDAAAS